MTRYVPLQRSIHNQAGYTPVTNMEFAATMTTVPLLREELSHVMQHMGIVIQKRVNKSNSIETFELVGLQSLKPNSNLFVLPNGSWLGGYKPAYYRAYPFILELDNANSQLQLCIKEDCVKFELNETDLPFFENDSNLSPFMTQMVEFLSKTIQNRQQTLSLLMELANEELIVPWQISYKEDNQDKSLSGLYHIDMAALKKLPPETVAKLNASGALEIAYAQHFSEVRIEGLSTLQKTYSELLKQQAQVEKEPDLDEVFGEKDEFFTF